VKDRIYGYETEYALLISPAGTGSRAPRRMRIYDSLEFLISSYIRVLAASYRKKGIFLENGGLFNYEALHSNFFEGLVEMATPECGNARDVALYHTAMTQLLSRAVKELNSNISFIDPAFQGTIFLGKSNVDSEGKCLGSHENYLVEERPGFFASLMLHLFVPFFWLTHLLLMAISFLPLIIAGPPILLTSVLGGLLAGILSGIPGLAGAGAKLRDFLFNILLGDEFIINHFARFHGDFSRLIFAPWVAVFSWFLYPLVFTRIRQELFPFLVTRSLFCGSGKVVMPGNDRPPKKGGDKAPDIFRISQRAESIRSLARIYFDDARRPIVDMRDFFLEPLTVLKPRKRLHVLFSDTNMSSIDVYLKIGITGLILEMIEEGHTFREACIKDPIVALQITANDLTMRRKIALKNGKSKTALEIQRYYLKEARDFYRSRLPFREEVKDLLDKWEFILNCLEITPQLLYRKVDWVTKKDLIEEVLRGRSSLGELAEIAEWAAYMMRSSTEPIAIDDASAYTYQKRLGSQVFKDFKEFLLSKEMSFEEFSRRWAIYCEILKVDFKFHQVDEDGYYYRLAGSNLVDDLFSTEEIEHAMSNPPPNTRAHIRGELIKKYGHKSESYEQMWYNEKVVQGKVKIGWNKFYSHWPWKKIQFNDPFTASLETKTSIEE
jgi:hypothetical protein